MVDNDYKTIKKFALDIVNKHPNNGYGLELTIEELSTIGFDDIRTIECKSNSPIGNTLYVGDIIGSNFNFNEYRLQISEAMPHDPTFDNGLYEAEFVVFENPLNKYIGLIRNAKINNIINGTVH